MDYAPARSTPEAVGAGFSWPFRVGLLVWSWGGVLYTFGVVPWVP